MLLFEANHTVFIWTYMYVVLPLFVGPIILVTTDYNSDRSAPKPYLIDHSWLLSKPHLIHHWFSDNWAVDLKNQDQRNHDSHPPTRRDGDEQIINNLVSKHERLTLLPIGINDRHVVNSHGDRRYI
jgi:hypothetical protein